MKQQYTLIKDTDANQLIVKEFGELDKDIMSLLCEERFDADKLRAASDAGKPALVAALRSNNLYPPTSHAEQLADAVMALYAAEDQQTADLTFDDKELLAKPEAADEEIEDLDDDVDIDDDDDDSDELDDLLDDDIKIKSTSSPLKIADDDQVDAEDET